MALRYCSKCHIDLNHALADYFVFAKNNPTLFVNPPDAGFEILLDEADIREAESQMAQRLKAKDLPIEWAQVGIAFQDQYTMILRDAVRFPNGSLGTYIRMVSDGTPGVIVLPVYQKQVLLINHFRHATRKWHIEIPRGFGIKGSSSKGNAQRELQEEIGAKISHLVALGHAYPDTGAAAEYNDFFYADVESYGDFEVDEGITKILPTPILEFERMIRENEITDEFTITAYALAKGRNLL
jgi:ADP-ribose pyrophosphatase